MLKVFLVEDEFVVREGIKKNVDWAARGYDFCGEAGDGELAFPMIQKLKPDIVITDIKMPFMDGLVLSRMIKKELPDTEIIILTGYEEFEYAKEAIKIGVAQYLSKPINGEELLREVDVIAGKIEERRKESEIRAKYMQDMAENTLQERKDLFQCMMTGTKSVEELLDMAGKLHIELSAPWYNIVLVRMKSIRHEYDEYSGSLVEIEQYMDKLDEETGVVSFDRNLEGKALLFRGDSKEEVEDRQNAYIERLKGTLSRYENVRYFGGVGMPVNRLLQLPTSFETASHAFAHRYLMKESTFLAASELSEDGLISHDDFHISDVDPKQVDRGRVKEFLRIGDLSETKYFVDEFFKDIGTSVLQSNIFRQYIMMDMYFCAVEFVESLEMPRNVLDEFELTPVAWQSEENALDYMVRLLQKALKLRDQVASNRYGDVMDEVLRYIEENYAQEDLTLNLLASHVNFSPNHLSTVFGQQTGQTLIKYLTEFRMNKAKELLKCTGKRSSVIAQEVGYKDSHYFSYLFKKTQGMTPTQYREAKGQGGE